MLCRTVNSRLGLRVPVAKKGRGFLRSMNGLLPISLGHLNSGAYPFEQEHVTGRRAQTIRLSSEVLPVTGFSCGLCHDTTPTHFEPTISKEQHIL